MKILSVTQIREADKYTIDNEPISSIDLMERAASQCFQWIMKHHFRGQNYYIFCGMGNNGGDGLAIGRMLLREGIDVHVFIIKTSGHGSDDFRINYERMKELKEGLIQEITAETELPEIPPEVVIIDAIFGTGLSRPLSGLGLAAIKYLNTYPNIKISIDVPSGLFVDESMLVKGGDALKADYTLSFNPPKLCFMIAENDRWVGRWMRLDIGLHQKYIDEAETPYHYTELDEIKPFYRKRRRFEHKGSFGHTLLIAGSRQKAGAALLAAKGCLAAGVGLLTVHTVPSVIQALNSSLPEAMASLSEHSEEISDLPSSLTPFTAIAAGPGLGTESGAAIMLRLLIQECKVPLLLDADALNILSENKTWLAFLPTGSILTPHPKEFERLAGPAANDFERLEMARDFAFRFQVYLVLKGGVTAVINPQRKVFFNSTGNPGLATGGSGDVLTGIIAGLLAQGYHPENAARLGVWLHGAAADLAIEKESLETLLPSQLPEYMASAWKMLAGTN
ncbi:MAG: NAD(P)H-hydrate dehydratase [Bacteroidales bacterium]|jgi:NAD(P)H-hydrate epimerase|nr:NAD(P)H-hydrate dehydratase [Bacteroidales bacterium]NPV35244.1 NAD(P)H-hydrate dehydratase [Bacteroidales bacterium]